MNKQIIIFVIFALFCIFQQSYCENNKEDHKKSLQEIYYGKGSDNDVNYYVFEIPKILETKLLIFTAQGITPESEPEIFVTFKSKEWPNNSSNAQYQAKATGLALIYITPQQIQENGSLIYTVGVKCSQDCSYKFIAFYEEDTTLGMNDIRYVYVGQQEQKLTIKVKKQGYKNFISEFELMNPFEIKHTFNALFKWDSEKDFPTITNAQSIGRGWGSGNGQGLFTWSAKEICNECDIRITLDAPVGSIIRVSTISYEEYRVIQPFTMVNDYSQDDNQKLFMLDFQQSKYSIDFEKQNLVFSLVVFQGDTDIFINEGQCNDKEEYQWSSEHLGDDRIVITPQERKSQDLKFCIKTTSKNYSLFSLYVYPNQIDKLHLPFDYPENGIVQQGEIVNYKLVLDSSNSFKINISLNTKSGQPELYVKLCYSSDKNCAITDRDISRRDKTQNLKYAIDSTIAKIEINHDGKECLDIEENNQNIDTCTYAIGIYGAKQKQSGYVLMASHDFYHTTLIENHQYHDYVEEGAINYYKFDLKNAENVQQLKFEVTGLIGEVTMFASSQVEYPTINLKDYLSFWNSIKYDKRGPNPTGIKNGVYFLGIQGDMPHNSYTVTVSVEYSNEQQSIYKLHQGVPAEISLKKYKDAAYFKFAIDPLTQKDIQIQIQQLKGKVHFYISTDKESLPPAIFNKNQDYKKGWSSVHSQIIIHREDVKWPVSGNFYGVVYPKIDSTSIDENTRFRITYHSENARTLKFQEINDLHINSSESQFFKVEIFSFDSLTISKKVSSFDQDTVRVALRIADQDIEAYPLINTKGKKDKSYADILVLQDFQPSVLSKEDIKHGCEFLEQEYTSGEKSRCFLYISAFGFEETYYQLHISNNSQNMMIFPDIGQHILLEKTKTDVFEGYQRNVYMYIQPSYEKILISYDSGKTAQNTKIFYFIQRLFDGNSKKTWTWPNSKPEQQFNFFHEKEGNLNTFLIGLEDIDNQGCNEVTEFMPVKCALLLVIQEDTPSQGNYEHSIELTITTQARRLQEGQAVRAKVDALSIDYYEFTIFDESIKSIIISATIWNYGQIKMFADKIDDDFNSNFIDAARFQSSTKHNEIVMKSEEFKGNTLVGNYRIGVESQKGEAVYSISYRKGGDIQFMTLEKGYPTEITMERGKKSIFLYNLSQNQANNRYSGFKIIMTEQVGDFQIAAMAVDISEKDYIKKAENSSNHDWSYNKMPNFNILEVSEEQINNACRKKDCAVVIIATSQSHTKGTILINDDSTKMIYLPPYLKTNDALAENESVTIMLLNDQELDLNIMVYKGVIEVSYINSLNKNQVITMSQSYETYVEVIPVIKYSQRMVVVTAKFDSLISIQANLVGSEELLTYGIPHHISFKQSKNIKNLVFHNNPDTYSGDIEVSIQYRYQENSRYMGTSPLAVNFYFTGFKHGQQKLGSKEFLQFNENMIYVLSPIKEFGQITIEIISKSTRVITDYYITVSEQGKSQLLVEGLERRGFGNKGDRKIYELMVPEQKYLLLETTTCMGYTHFSAAHSYQDIQEGISDLSFKEIYNDNGLIYSRVYPKPNSQFMYISSEIQSKKTVYSISPYWFDLSQTITPLELIQRNKLSSPFRAEYDSQFDRIKFKIEALWADFDAVKQAGWEIKSYYYQYLFSETNQDLTQIAMCKSRIGDKLISKDVFFHEAIRYIGIDSLSEKKYKIIFDLKRSELIDWKKGKDLDKDLYIKVIGHVNVFNIKTKQMQTFKYPYETYNLKTKSLFGSSEGMSFWGIFGIIILSLAFLLVAFKLYQKYRQMKSGDVEASYGNLASKTSFVEMN